MSELTKEEIDAVLIHLEEVEAASKKRKEALEGILEEAVKHATDEEPRGWLWIDIVIKAKHGLGIA